MNKREEIMFYNLVTSSIEGTIKPEEHSQLIEFLLNDKEAMEHYSTYISFVSLLRNSDILKNLNTEQITDMSLWAALAEDAKTAPPVEVVKEESEHDLSQNIVSQSLEKRKVGKLNLVFLVLNAAAILFIFLFLIFVPPKSGIEVATVSECLNAKWADSEHALCKGFRLTDGNERVTLQQGFIELLFDNQARVTIEGPADFQILTEDRISLNYGKIYASIPNEAIGFSVYTSNSKVVDLGTEFGVSSDLHGNTQLHVIRGKTVLMAGKRGNKIDVEIGTGAARKISGNDGIVSEIECDYTQFTRRVDSATEQIWRGGNLSLASIAAGFDGFCEVGSLMSLDPVSGEFVESTKSMLLHTNNKYTPVSASKFIDGVFVPDGESGPVQITSLNHVFNCPDTGGLVTHKISTYKGVIEDQHMTIPPVIVDGQEISEEPVLMLHSNVGITFDLKAIRESLHQLNVDGFKAIGFSSKEHRSGFDFCVLVDGRVIYERSIAATNSIRKPVPFNIEFSPQDRFLTLIVTDGEEKDYANDFFYLISPELVITDILAQ